MTTIAELRERLEEATERYAITQPTVCMSLRVGVLEARLALLVALLEELSEEMRLQRIGYLAAQERLEAIFKEVK